MQPNVAKRNQPKTLNSPNPQNINTLTAGHIPLPLIGSWFLVQVYGKQVAGSELVMDPRVVEAFRSVITDTTLDK